MRKAQKSNTSVISSNRILLISVLVIVLLGVSLYYTRNFVKPASQATQAPQVTQSAAEEEESGNHSEYEEPALEKEVVVIKITNKGFQPQTVRVKAAYHIIAFENVDTRVHYVKADPTDEQEFNTGPIAPGQQISVVEYTEPGTYTYSDDKNSTAKGAIVVEP